jgi:hypothetical protein
MQFARENVGELLFVGVLMQRRARAFRFGDDTGFHEFPGYLLNGLMRVGFTLMGFHFVDYVIRHFVFLLVLCGYFAAFCSFLGLIVPSGDGNYDDDNSVKSCAVYPKEM